MKKIVITALLFMGVLGAQTNYSQPQVIGFMPTNNAGVTTQNCNAAGTWWAFSYIPPANVTLQNVSIEISSVTGTLAATDMQLDVFSDHGSLATAPNVSLTSTTTSSQQTAGFIKFGGSGTGINFVLTSNTIYWMVLSNHNGTPASNFPTVRYGTDYTGTPGLNANNGQQNSWLVDTTTNSGTSWSTNVNKIAMVRLDFTDGSSAGLPYTNMAMDATNVVYSAREVGNQFATQGVKLNLRGIIGIVGKAASAPTGLGRFGVWDCTGGSTCTNLGYTGGATGCIPVTTVNGSGQNIQCYFSSSVQLPANGTVIISLAEASNADASSKYWNLGSATVDSAAASLALKQLGGTNTKGAYCTGTCTTYSNWTTTTTTVYGLSMILEPAGEFTTAGGASGGVN